MGYPTIDKFDIRFIERTKKNIESYKAPNKFTHLINSLVGLIFIPHEFHKNNSADYKIDFLNTTISEHEILALIFKGEEKLTDEKEKQFLQPKFHYIDNKGNPKSIDNTLVGDLLRLFRNGIAHCNITPVAEGDYWKGIIVKNFNSQNNVNFETFLTQKEVRVFATFIADRYLRSRV